MIRPPTDSRPIAAVAAICAVVLSATLHRRVSDPQRHARCIRRRLHGKPLSSRRGRLAGRSPDDALSIDARHVIETDEGLRITVVNRGIRTGPREVMQRLTRGDAVAPSEYYFRTAAQFDAPHGSKYDWVNLALFIGVANVGPT